MTSRMLAALWLGFALLPLGSQAQTQAITRTIEFQYDAYGTVIQQVVEPDDPKYRVTTSFVAELRGDHEQDDDVG